MNALVECEARGRDCKKLRSHSRSCSTQHSLNICLPPDKYMTTRNVSLESTDSTNPEMFNLYVLVNTFVRIIVLSCNNFANKRLGQAIVNFVWAELVS